VLLQGAGMMKFRWLRITAKSWAWVAAVVWGGLIEEGQARNMTLLDIARVRSVRAVEVSPDGKWFAYTVAVPRRPFVEEDGPAWQELHVVGPDGRSRPFVTGAVQVSEVRWVPEGRAISFRQQRVGDEKTSLYVIPLDGGEARRVWEHPAGVGAYAWSPDGREVAFLAEQEVTKEQQEEREQGFKAEVFEEDWRSTRVWLTTPQLDQDPWEDGKQEEAKALELPGTAHAVEWSPDGRWLAVALAPTPSVDDALMRQRIHVVERASGEVHGLVATPGKLGDFAWSPDSERLALVGTTDVHDPREGRLLVVSRSGGVPQELVPGYLGHFAQVEWIGADAVLALGQVGVWSELRRVDLEGEQEVLVEAGTRVIKAFALAAGSERLGLIVESAAHPPELFEARVRLGKWSRLTEVNPWLSEVDLAIQEVVRHEARDGLELEGVLIRPLGEERGRRYPLILSVHGGPESRRPNGWLTSYSSLGQVAAAQGFSVFYPNYRGSTGRGVEFSKLGQGDYAGGEFNDLVDAVNYLVETGLVDRGRVGVTGGSYGGFATAWCATALTEHFAAGVMFVGISDHLSKFGTTDIPNEMMLVHARSYPWNDWDWFLERSPIRHAAKGRTPLLILHGKADTRVHPSQSLELYRYLKTHDQVPVRLVWYPGEGHGNRYAAARLDYSMRVLRWFEHFLQGPRGEPPPYELDYGPFRPETPEE
jgi:dipeptidyl aminopeptidase/acylaminoacyl peptidase